MRCRISGAWAVALSGGLALASSACGDDDREVTGGGAAGGGGGTSGSGGGGGTSGTAGSAGVAGAAGSAGAPVCPGIMAPTLVTQVAGASFPSPGEYQGGTTPLLDLDSPDASWTWNDPHVLRVGAELWMYASATQNFDFPVRIYRLRAPDGVSFLRDPAGPVVDPGAPGTFDAGGVETPSVVFFNGRYHMFYTAYEHEWDDPQHNVFELRIGHATSCDGVSWQRAGSKPVVSPSGQSDADPSNDWYAFVVGEPGAVVYEGVLHLYFTAVGASAKFGTSLQVVGLVTTADGLTWSAPELVLEPDQALYPRIIDPGPPIDGWVGYSTPNAIVLNDAVHLFVDVAYDPDEASWRQIRLHHAKSADGRTGWIQDPAPIASAGDFPWAVDEIRAPHALVDGTALKLFFAGHELDGAAPEHFAIGAMTAPLVAP